MSAQVPSLGQTAQATLHEMLQLLGFAILQAQSDLAGRCWEVVQKPRLAGDRMLGLPLSLGVPLPHEVGATSTRREKTVKRVRRGGNRWKGLRTAPGRNEKLLFSPLIQLNKHRTFMGSIRAVSSFRRSEREKLKVKFT